MDFLLRSGKIANIHIQNTQWNNHIDSTNIQNLKNHNRWVTFNTSQNLKIGETLAGIEYKIDFSPLLKTAKSICKHVFTLVIVLFILFYFKNSFNYLAYFLITLGIVVRFYQYIFHKDLRLDEAMVAFSTFGIAWRDLFFAPLPNMQSMPLLMFVISKFLGNIFGYSEHVLYFLPFVFGVLTLFIAFKIAEYFFKKNTFGFLFFISMICGSLDLIYYSAEFKQYGIEAFCAFLLVYCYLKNYTFKSFFILSIPCFLASHTGIFVAFACVCGYFYKTFSLPFYFKTWFKNSASFFILSSILGILFILYYFLYVRFQAVSGFYEYWEIGFIPLNIKELPNFFIKALPIFDGFTPFNSGDVIPFYFALLIIWLYSFWKKRRDFFFVCAAMLFIYIILSALKLYPWGHAGIIGGRLSLFMSVFFYILCSSGAVFLFEKFSNKIFKMFCMIILSFFVVLTFRETLHRFSPNYFHIQQTHDFIAQTIEEYQQSPLKESQKCVLVYSATKHAFLYYSFLENANIPYQVFDKEFNVDAVKITDLNCQKAWILASHYPAAPWEETLQTNAKSLGKNTSFNKAKTGWGSFLIRIEN